VKRLEHSPEIGDQLKPSRFWKIRIGDYRVIYEVNGDSNQVIILFVGHRKNVYDEFSRLV
jgi:mRNA interferase RelE/StbE